jgi:hypothetical protein
MRARVQLLLWAGGACAGLVVPRVFAQGASGPAPMLTVSGVCPPSRAVENVLATLLPAGVANGPTAQARISDRGDTYVVSVGERAKTYTDPARDCAERSRVAAAFIALALAPDAQPATAASSADAVVTAPSSRPLAARPATRPPPRLLRIDARGALQSAPQSGLFAPGAELGITIGGQKFGARAECGWLAPTSLTVSDAGERILLERFPCALGPILRFFPGAGPLEVSLDAGIVVGAIRARGRGFATTYDSARLELGARLALDAILPLGAGATGARQTGLAPVVGLEATVDPAVYDLVVTPRSVVAQTPVLWAGVTVGVCWSVE